MNFHQNWSKFGRTREDFAKQSKMEGNIKKSVHVRITELTWTVLKLQRCAAPHFNRLTELIRKSTIMRGVRLKMQHLEYKNHIPQPLDFELKNELEHVLNWACNLHQRLWEEPKFHDVSSESWSRRLF